MPRERLLDCRSRLRSRSAVTASKGRDDAARAVAELARERAAAEDAFAIAEELLRLASGFAGLRGFDRLGEDPLGQRGVMSDLATKSATKSNNRSN